MKIVLNQVGKKYTKRWLFKGISFLIESNQTIAITGYNGSGKSTLLQIVLGYQLPSTGSVQFFQHDQVILPEHIFNHIAFVAPYLELPEELTLLEAIDFHFSFKQFNPKQSITEAIHHAGLTGNETKFIKYFSSGMKQRLKLLLAFYDTSEVLLLDEPTSNLDETGIAWYQQLLATQHHTRTIIIASNQKYEYELCDAVMDVTGRV